MIRIDKHNCCGCKACADICPQKCISFSMDKEGFYYPLIDESKCINCHLCEKVCPVRQFSTKQITESEAYYGVHQEFDVVKNSSSGGAFTAIYEHLLNYGYIIYGVTWQEHLQVAYSRATTKEECKNFRKSKYVMADTKQLYPKIYLDLMNGEKVLVCATPCVCAAIVNYMKLKKCMSDNLLLIDIICHGVGSQKVFDEYISELEIKYGKVERLNFRFKPYDLICNENYTKTKKFIQIIFQDGREYVRAVEDDPFLISYYNHLHYRQYCKKCSFARPERVSDITLGDAWGIQKVDDKYNPLKGVSLCVCHTKKGKLIINEIADIMRFKPISYKWAISANEQLSKPTTFHRNRDKFYKLLPKYGFSKSVYKTIKPPFQKKFEALLFE